MRRNKWPGVLANLSVFAMLPLVGATAEAATSTTALETALLARAYSIDLRCQVLSTADGGDLARYLLNSQALLARQSSLKEAQAAVADGKAAAAGSLCTAYDKSFVVSTLAQVRRAGTEAAGRAKPSPPYNGREPLDTARRPSTVPPPVVNFPPLAAIPQIEPAPQEKAAPPVQPEKVKQAKAKSNVRKKKKKIVARVPSMPNAKAATSPRKSRKSGSLRQYGSLAETYYVALKCRSISYEDAMRLYDRVIKSHRAAVAAYPDLEVRAVLRTAKANADFADCD